MPPTPPAPPASTPPSEPDHPGSPTDLTRRTALKIVAVGTLGAAAGAGSTAWLTGLDRPASPRYLFFTETEAVRLIAICEQLIPRDDTPGATDVGVIDYIDRQLVGALARFQSSYRRGLDSFDRTSLALDHGPFEHLTFERQTAALRRLEAGAVPSEFWTDPSAQAFFELVLDHTRQGFYGSPRHGGNRNYASYRMLGLAYPNVIGRNPGVATGA